MELNRGDIVIVNLAFKEGEEVARNISAVIISGDDENSILDTVILMPLSSELIEDMEPYRMRLSARDNLIVDSDILINQIKTISKTKIKEKIAKLTNDEYTLVINNLCKNFQ